MIRSAAAKLVAAFVLLVSLAPTTAHAQPSPPPAEGASSGTDADAITIPTPPRYTLEGVEIRGNVRTRDRVILRYIRFKAGMILEVDDPELDLLRFRLLGTGFFQTVSLSLRKGSKSGYVYLVVTVSERNTIVVNDVWLGLAAKSDDQGRTQPLSSYAGVDISETNLAGTGVTLGGAIGLAADQLALRVRFLDPAFLGSAWMTQGILFYNVARDFYGNQDVLYDDPVGGATRVQNYAQVRYRRFGGLLGVGRDLSTSTQLWLDYRLESVSADLPLAASHRRGKDTEPLTFDLEAGKSVVSSLRATMVHDTRDSPVLPTHGWFGSLVSDVSLAPLGSSYPYEKLQLRLSHWWPIWRRKGHVARVEIFGGLISGSAPVFEKFYPADFSDFLPDRLLELNIDSRGAPNLLRTSIAEVRHGDYAGKISGEYRIPIYRGSRAIYGIDAFVSAGLYAIAAQRDITDPARGYRGLARAPADLTFNLGLRMDTKAGGFLFAFANVLGFLPVFGGRE
ncbi:MAG: BamA/TamA family outer membrane protein [Polyangiaceae bacterium]